MKDMHGNRTPIENKASALADYLYSKHWSPIAHPPALENRPKLSHNDLPYDALDFTTEEVESAIDKLKTNKAPGPDGCITKLFKFLDHGNIQILTACFNGFWRHKYVPDDFTRAQIESIYKKGDPDNPENYRPISLLNTSYKIVAYITLFKK